jgi:hypothetical protein
VHDLVLAIRDADQVADLHLAKPQGDIIATDFPADLYDPGTFTDTAMADHAGRQVGFGQDFREHLFHLGDIHNGLGWDSCVQQIASPQHRTFEQTTHF